MIPSSLYISARCDFMSESIVSVGPFSGLASMFLFLNDFTTHWFASLVWKNLSNLPRAVNIIIPPLLTSQTVFWLAGTKFLEEAIIISAIIVSLTPDTADSCFLPLHLRLFGLLPGLPLLWKVCFDDGLGCGEKTMLVKAEVECWRGKSQLMCVKASALKLWNLSAAVTSSQLRKHFHSCFWITFVMVVDNICQIV